jgi:hypothetical protein
MSVIRDMHASPSSTWSHHIDFGVTWTYLCDRSISYSDHRKCQSGTACWRGLLAGWEGSIGVHYVQSFDKEVVACLSPPFEGFIQIMIMDYNKGVGAQTQEKSIQKVGTVIPFWFDERFVEKTSVTSNTVQRSSECCDDHGLDPVPLDKFLAASNAIVKSFASMNMQKMRGQFVVFAKIVLDQ